MKKVYMCFGTDVIHNGHIEILRKAAELGEVTVGVLTDEVMASYKRYPIINLEQRLQIIESIKYVSKVIVQEELDYTNNLRKVKPDYVVHGDDWRTGYQASIRSKVIDILKEWDGELVEFPYTEDNNIKCLENTMRERLSMPEFRRARLRKLLKMNRTIRVLEVHSGITGLIAENTKLEKDGKINEFDAMWLSSLCDSTVKGKPDIELVDMSSRLKTIEEILEVTTKPIILDGDTGGLVEHFNFNIRTLERMGVSAIIIEDKEGLKKNSLFGTEVHQDQASIESFCEKIRVGKAALKTKEFMLIARIESLILEKGMEDALARAQAYVNAGADGIMIHSRKKEPDEIFAFCDAFRLQNKQTPIIVVPTTFNKVYEEELYNHGINIVIYANQLIRSAFPAMQNTARVILENERAYEVDKLCMPVKEILTLIKER
ncbi:phosphoenolpyruvate mutase [Cellulosilyticum lentocellum]|uniref:phosphoenolpyruvate mutase n=1 Tax=Cellulosilyticum lentocellum (strain ATCC 49066 / DSM 5427 / NCIMB 11756 / RHM5) TaxID=642492 RepID=F2JT41_CELLD|nr:phosphoenolpyruvate mutase [Cellulosilyticum lentocellum]ADZ85260.1 phosphoenolpyruvate phosphomutase [Cellulosilyticum lentocellum DSM 5427]